MTREDHAPFAHIVESWLDSPDDFLDPDTVLDRAMEQVETKPQRRAEWPVWRIPFMNKTVPIIVAAAAVVVIALIGFGALGGTGGFGGPGPSDAEPPATTAPTTEPTPSPSADAETTLLIADGQADDPEDQYPPLTVTVPTGWGIDDPTGVLIGDSADPPAGAFMMVFAEREYWVYGDPCQWSSTKPDTASSTVDELVEALANQASREPSTPEDITVDGFAGKKITLHVPDDAAFEDCDDGSFGYWASIDLEFGDDGSSPSRHAQAPGQVDTLYILDLDGVIMIIDASYYAETPAEDIATLEGIVESGSFGD